MSNTATRRSLRILVAGAGVSGIAAARGMLRDGHDVTVFEQRPEIRAGGGAVTIWPNGATVLNQLGVAMDGAGQRLSTVRVVMSTGCRLATLDVTAMAARLGAPVRMVPRHVLLDRLLDTVPAERIRCNSRVVQIQGTRGGVRVAFADGTCAEGDLLIGADGLHSVVRDALGAKPAQPTGWCSWQGLASAPNLIDDKHSALVAIGEHGNVGLWPAGESALQWWFDLPWSGDFVRPSRPLEVLRAHFTGWSDAIDRVLAALTDADLADSPYPHFRHPIPGPGSGAVTLLGDAAHTMPPTLAQGTNQALLDTMVLRRALSSRGDLVSALRWYEKTRRRRVNAVSRVASLPVAHRRSVLEPAALISDRLHTWALSAFLRSTSHPRISAVISRDDAATVSQRSVRQP
ncbi:2-polyprenyl-6-methoxyphenol hydroxylase-like oxidoreductase [Mycolicibacter terrae]|nr:2-polyprenyl-6-methoxyphenol hydroxylase-like oxidoreductase [Mycolicibacter terrae]